MNKLRAENFPYKIAMPKLTEQKKKGLAISKRELLLLKNAKNSCFFLQLFT